MSGLALLMQQQQREESTCDKGSGITTSWHPGGFESGQKDTSCRHQNHDHLCKAPPRQLSSNSTGNSDGAPNQHFADAQCASYSEHYLAAMHPCSPTSAPTWNWMHTSRQNRAAAANQKRQLPPTFGESKNNNIAASIEELNRQYYQQIYMGTTATEKNSNVVPTDGFFLDDVGYLPNLCHHQEDKDEKRSSEEPHRARLPEVEAPEETIFELEM